MENNTLKTSPRDFFLYLLSNVALYYCAGWLVSLLYDCINYAYGSVNYYDSAWIPSGMRWAIASLLIVFPVYLWVTHLLNSDLETQPEKREMRVRKWLMYLTLSLASAAFIIDIVALIYQFLSGEFVMTFFLKVFAVAVVSAMVFGYYLYELRRDAGRSAPARGLFRWLSVALVVISMLAGFLVIGSPADARDRQYDQRRVSDLQEIQSQVVRHWQYKQQLPPSLGELTDLIADYLPPVDPVTQIAYEYRVTGKSSFELCATFAKEAKGSEATSAPFSVLPSLDTWSHPVGRTCFARTIDPQLYPAIK